MSTGKYRWQTCGTPLELFAVLYSRHPIDEDSGEIREAYEENVPGSNEYHEVQCSEDADHYVGLTH